MLASGDSDNLKAALLGIWYICDPSLLAVWRLILCSLRQRSLYMLAFLCQFCWARMCSINEWPKRFLNIFIEQLSDHKVQEIFIEKCFSHYFLCIVLAMNKIKINQDTRFKLPLGKDCQLVSNVLLNFDSWTFNWIAASTTV